MKRHLAESRRENDDLLKAVAYLRSKLDTGGEDTPTTLHTSNNGDVIDDAGDDDDDAEQYAVDYDHVTAADPDNCSSECKIVLFIIFNCIGYLTRAKGVKINTT